MADKEEIQGMLLDFIDYAESHDKYTDQRQRAEVCREFEQGKQWTQEQYNRYKQVGIEPITINRCLSTIKALDGMFFDNLQDITAIARKGGSEVAAQVLTEVVKHAQDEGGYEIACFDVFHKGNIDTEGWFLLDIDKQKTANGSLTFKGLSFFDVLLDPDCNEYDIDAHKTGAKYAIVRECIDAEDLSGIYKGALEMLQTNTGGMESYIRSVIGTEFYDETATRYRLPVYTVYWKESVPAVLFKDKKTNRTRVLTKNTSEYSKRAKKSKRYSVENITTHVLHKSIMINGELMEDIENPFGEGFNVFPLQKYVPIFRDDYSRGTLDDIKSLNYEENLRRTQVARLLNLTANSGWKVKDKSNGEAVRELMQYGSVPGYVVAENDFGGSVEKINPNQLSQGHLVLSEQTSNDIKEVSGVNAAMQGYDAGTKDEPGVVLNLRREQGQAANSGMFKNYKFTLELLGKKVIRMIDSMDVYTDDEIKAIVSESHLIDSAMMQKAHDFLFSKIGATLPSPQLPQAPAPEQWAMVRPEDTEQFYESVKQGVQGAQLYNQQYPALKQNFDVMVKELAIQMILDSLSDGDLTMYGIKVTTSPQTTTARIRAFMMMDQLSQRYPGLIPPETILEYSDIPNKEAIMQQIKQARQQQMGAA